MDRRKKLNLELLHGKDSGAVDIVLSLTSVHAYKFNHDTQAWVSRVSAAVIIAR